MSDRLFKYIVVVMIAAFAFAGCSEREAKAHLVAKPADKTLTARIKSQSLNLAHMRYVCNNGAAWNKKKHCPWVPALERELAKSKAKLAPPIYIAPYPWHQIALCESSYGTGYPKWHLNSGNGYYGGLQFDYGTWHEAQRNLGVRWTEYAHQATPAQQVRAAMTLPLTRWPHCAARYR
jgi:hypothetical protein